MTSGIYRVHQNSTKSCAIAHSLFLGPSNLSVVKDLCNLGLAELLKGRCSNGAPLSPSTGCSEQKNGPKGPWRRCSENSLHVPFPHQFPNAKWMRLGSCPGHRQWGESPSLPPSYGQDPSCWLTPYRYLEPTLAVSPHQLPGRPRKHESYAGHWSKGWILTIFRQVITRLPTANMPQVIKGYQGGFTTLIFQSHVLWAQPQESICCSLRESCCLIRMINSWIIHSCVDRSLVFCSTHGTGQYQIFLPCPSILCSIKAEYVGMGEITRVRVKVQTNWTDCLYFQTAVRSPHFRQNNHLFSFWKQLIVFSTQYVLWHAGSI